MTQERAARATQITLMQAWHSPAIVVARPKGNEMRGTAARDATVPESRFPQSF